MVSAPSRMSSRQGVSRDPVFFAFDFHPAHPDELVWKSTSCTSLQTVFVVIAVNQPKGGNPHSPSVHIRPTDHAFQLKRAVSSETVGD